MSRVKILYCITKSVWGGAQRYVYDLATSIDKNRFEVVVASGGTGPLFSKLEASCVRTISIPALERDIYFVNEIRAFFKLIRTFIHERPDVIHLNSSKIGILGAVAGRCASLVIRKKIKIVFTAHGWVFHEDRSFLQKKIIKLLTWVGGLFQDRVIVINTKDYDAAKRLLPRNKIAFILNGIGNINLFSRMDARRHIANTIKKDLPDTTFVLGTVAELTKNKGLIYLVQALASFDSSYPFHAVIVGNGEDQDKIRQEIEKLGIASQVSLAGFIPDAVALLPAFDVFLLPSIKEGLPYIILEAMSAGLPIIATHVGGIPDVITHKKNGILIPPKSPYHLQSALTRILEDEKLRTTLSRRAKETLKTKFNLDAMLKATSALYLS